MKYKDGIILQRTPYIIGCGFNIGEYEIQCPECGKIGKYGYDYASDRIPKYCTFCRADFEDTNPEKENKPVEITELSNHQIKFGR